MSRKQTMKVYHGIPKSITDEHTIFYASLDGTIEPEIGSVDVNTASDFISDPMGYHPISGGNMVFTATKSVDIFTIDMYIPKFPKVSSGNKAIIALKTETNSDLFYIQIPSQQDYLALVQTDNTGWHTLTKSQQDCFIRIVVNKGNVTNYINGIKISQSITIKSFTKFNKIRIMLGSSTWNGVADIHISDIDRGDYFPNLPQDFIDGKAIIKPRMGQQQIKGDPLYSQYTLLKVPNANNIDSSEFYKKDGYDYYVNIPELKTTGSYSWNAADATITIKGLNGEIISGVIDNDTALCRITAIDTTNYSIIVDSLAGLTNGDSVKVKASTGSISIVNRYVKILDITKNLIELHSKSDLSDKISYGIEILNGYIFETTASSSSPVVKTQDGTVVSGTWSGLGTNEAIFTLGDNSNILGKDLYVEYSLNIPHNNSDFNELPYSIDKAYTENGIEMSPVNEIVITDDFKGKICGSMKECPHYSGYRARSSLVLPSSGLFIEEPLAYETITNLDNVARGIYNKTNTSIPQQVFIFDLVEMIERKLGCKIPSGNKIQWIKENVTKISVNHYGYGEGPNGNKIYMKVLNKGQWVGDITHSSPTTTSKIFSWTGNGNIGNTDNGKVSFLVYTDASDGIIASNVYTDYISIELTLKIDSTFTTLYCKNTRAREDKCNPVLIQKETKTVKRYLPSKECFTTECTYINQYQSAGNIVGDNSRTRLIESNYIYVTSLGTGAKCPTKEFYRDCLSNIGDSYIKSILYNLTCTPLEINLGNCLRFSRVDCVASNNDNRYLLPSKYFEGDYICIKPFLTVKSGELLITLSLRHIKNGNSIYHTEREYTVANRPLIK